MSDDSDKARLVEEIRKSLQDLKGEDCYRKGILFKDGDSDREAFTWLKETLQKVIERKGPNRDKAARVLLMLERLLVHGYIDHLMMHLGQKTLEDNSKLRETVDHLATKLGKTH